jgi:hypothetical protein
MKDDMKNLPKGLIESSREAMRGSMELPSQVRADMAEALHGKQHKLDVNNNDEVDAHDFKLLRRKKQVKEALDRGVPISQLVQVKSPAIPELHEAIGQLVHFDRMRKTASVVIEGRTYKIREGHYSSVDSYLLEAPMFNVRDKTGRIIGVHQHGTGFTSSRPDEFKSGPDLNHIPGAKIDHSSEVKRDNLKPMNRNLPQIKEETEELNEGTKRVLKISHEEGNKMLSKPGWNPNGSFKSGGGTVYTRYSHPELGSLEVPMIGSKPDSRVPMKHRPFSKLKEGHYSSVDSYLLEAPMFNVRDKTGRIIGVHQHGTGFTSSRPDEFKSGPDLNHIPGAKIDHSSEVKFKPRNRNLPQMKEEVEQISETSYEKAAKYITAAAKDAEYAGQAQAYHGHDVDFKRGQNRQRGIERAVKKLLTKDLAKKEEVEYEDIEQISETSYEKATKYRSAAMDQMSDTFKGRGRKSAATLKLRAKRTDGLKKAEAIIAKHNEAKWEAREKEMNKNQAEFSDHIEANHNNILAKHGFELVNSGHHDNNRTGEGNDHVRTYIAHHDNGHSTMVSVIKKGGTIGPYFGSTHEIRAVNTKGTSWSSLNPYHNHGDDLEHSKKKFDVDLHDHLKRITESGSGKGNW